MITDFNRNIIISTKHSRIVKILKIILPLFSLLTFITVLTVILSNTYFKRNNPINFKYSMEDGSASLTMKTPHISGTSNLYNYDFNAATATQNINNTKLIDFFQVEGKITDSQRNTYKIQSKIGKYDGTKNIITLNGDVIIIKNEIETLSCNTLYIETTNGYARADGNVELNNAVSSIKSDSLELFESNKTFIFTGNVQLNTKRQ